VRPWAVVSRSRRWNSFCISGSTPEVGSSRMSSSGRCIKCEHDPELLAVAFRQLVDLPVEGYPEPLDQMIAQLFIHLAACTGDPVEHAPAGHPRVKLELAREVCGVGADRDAVTVAVQPEHAGAPVGRTMKREQ